MDVLLFRALSDPDTARPVLGKEKARRGIGARKYCGCAGHVDSAAGGCGGVERGGGERGGNENALEIGRHGFVLSKENFVPAAAATTTTDTCSSRLPASAALRTLRQIIVKSPKMGRYGSISCAPPRHRCRLNKPRASVQ